jgi:uncharacterized membrane protein YraQ (UPF0718 family)
MQHFKEKIKNINGGIKFLSLTVLLYLILAIINFSLFTNGLERAGALVIKILPSILGAFVLIFVFNYILSDQKIKNYLTGKLNWRKYFLTVGLGILSSGPIYAWYPFLADLKKDGFKNSLITIFLYNRAIKLPFIPLLVYYFSWQFVTVVTLLMIVFSILNGLIMDKLIKD